MQNPRSPLSGKCVLDIIRFYSLIVAVKRLVAETGASVSELCLHAPRRGVKTMGAKYLDGPSSVRKHAWPPGPKDHETISRACASTLLGANATNIHPPRFLLSSAWVLRFPVSDLVPGNVPRFRTSASSRGPCKSECLCGSMTLCPAPTRTRGSRLAFDYESGERN